MLRGTGVSEGCGIGKALIIQHRSLDYSGVVFGGAQQEKERLRAAINAFMQKTEQLRDRLQASAGEKEAAILDGHMEMLRDPFMLSQMEEMIDGGATAEAAADGVCNQFIAMFSGMDDELTRQRASDIADVREDLLGIMLGAEQVDLGAIEPGTVLGACGSHCGRGGRYDLPQCHFGAGYGHSGGAVRQRCSKGAAHRPMRGGGRLSRHSAAGAYAGADGGI